jgi:LmbE family N-acetylglucosaminyl deacetylase
MHAVSMKNALILTEAHGYPDLQVRRDEVKNVHRYLKVKSIHLDFPTTQLDTLPMRELAKAIEETVKSVKPEIVYTHFGGDVNQDHRAIFEATLIALRFNRSVKKLFCYETLSSTEFGPIKFESNHYVDISKTLKTKIEAMKGYRKELKAYPHPRSLAGIRLAAKSRGLFMGVKAAEAFRLIRSFESF